MHWVFSSIDDRLRTALPPFSSIYDHQRMVYESRRPEAKKLAPTAAVIQTQELHYKLPRGTQKVEAMFRKALLRNEKMNVSLLLQGYEAKRKLSQLFQSEGHGQASHPSTASVTRDSIPAVQTDIEQNSKPFR